MTLISRAIPFDDLVAYYAAADVAWITPLADGMNLVAKEFAACRMDGDGVLVLSEFAGAAIELKSAVLANPFSHKSHGPRDPAGAGHAGGGTPRAHGDMRKHDPELRHQGMGRTPDGRPGGRRRSAVSRAFETARTGWRRRQRARRSARHRGGAPMAEVIAPLPCLIGVSGQVGRRVTRAFAPPASAGSGWPAPGPTSLGHAGRPARPAGLPGRAVFVLPGALAQSRQDLAQNTKLAQAGVAAARQWGAAHCFVVSSSSVYGATGPDPVDESARPDPRNAYARSKLDMERATAAPGVTALRLANVAGASEPFLAIRRPEPPVLDRFGDGSGPRRSYIGPVTLARVMVRLAELAEAGADLPPVLNLAAPGEVAMRRYLHRRRSRLYLAAGAAGGGLPPASRRLATDGPDRARPVRRQRPAARGRGRRSDRVTPEKRALDLALALILGVVLLPIGLGIALAILVTSGRPVLYRSERMRGLHDGFNLLKFRTMRPDPADRGVTGGDKADRITAIGRGLRRTRLDELPQIWNVLRGDISFVGPRPPLRRYVERFPDLYARVLRTRPGITGLATLAYHRHEERLLSACRDSAETEAVYTRRCVPAKARLDLIYAAHRSTCFDLRLMGMTVARMLSRSSG